MYCEVKHNHTIKKNPSTANDVTTTQTLKLSLLKSTTKNARTKEERAKRGRILAQSN